MIGLTLKAQLRAMSWATAINRAAWAAAVLFVFFVVSAAAPLTVAASSAPLAFLVGGIGAPGAMLASGIVLILFAIGFTAMSRYVRNTGAFYAYAAAGLGKPVGVGIAFVTMRISSTTVAHVPSASSPATNIICSKFSECAISITPCAPKATVSDQNVKA